MPSKKAVRTTKRSHIYQALISSIVFIIFVSLSGCSGSGSSGGGAQDNIKIENVTFPATILYPNLEQSIQLTITSPKDYSADNNGSEIFFFFAFDDLSNNDEPYWFDSTSFSELKKGTHTYTIDIIVPADINSSEYTFQVQVSDSERVHDTYVSSSFPIIDYDNNPDIELASLTLDLEYAGHESEFDTITSSEINTTAISKLGGTLPALDIAIKDPNEPLYISSAATIRSNLADANITVTSCIQVGTECIALPILQLQDNNTTVNPLDEDNVTLTATRQPLYLPELNIGTIQANLEKTVNLDFRISAADVQNFITALMTKLASDPNAVLNAELVVTVSTTDESSIATSDNNIIRYPLQLLLDPDTYSDLLNGQTPTLAPARASTKISGECGLKKIRFLKEYERYKYGRRFGAGGYFKGRSWLDADGVHAKADASIRLRRFSTTKHRILRANMKANINPASFSDTGYDIEVSSQGYIIYTRSKSLADATGLSEPLVSLTQEEENSLSTGTTSPDTNGTVTTEATLLRQKRLKAAKKKLLDYKTTTTTDLSLISLSQSKRWAKSTEIQRQIMFSIIPIVVNAGAEARIGYDAEIYLDGLTSITAELEPNAYLGAYLEAGVGAGVRCCGYDIEYSAGAGSNLWLLSERFNTKVTGSLSFVENDNYIVQIDGNISEKVVNYINTMHGETYAYARYWGPKKFSEPTETTWKTRTHKKVFADWEGSNWESNLLNRNQNLFTIPIADECN